MYWPELQTERLQMYIHFYQIIKIQGPGRYNSLQHTDNKKTFFESLCNTKLKGSTHDLLGQGSARKLDMFFK